jgi:hypothetical protein
MQQQGGFPDPGLSYQGAPPPYSVKETGQGTCYIHATFDPSAERKSGNRFGVEMAHQKRFKGPFAGLSWLQVDATHEAIHGASRVYNKAYTELEMRHCTKNGTSQLPSEVSSALGDKWEKTVLGMVENANKIVDDSDIALEYLDSAAWKANVASQLANSSTQSVTIT